MGEFKHIIRIASTDLDGRKHILVALKKIKGVNIMFANMALAAAGIDKTKKAGDLLDSEAEKLNDIILNPKKHGAPGWMLNRRKDIESGEDTHLLMADLAFTKETDIKRMMKTKSYKGLRHQARLPVRGQRTKSNFRRNKGKGLGVKKKTK
ncbi:30S ribosomal protein S13 [Candidatus Woesearchaeota archaeon]|nr:30S ribosomal protein S13 [Candidatus Woesearchaeota archaeon]